MSERLLAALWALYPSSFRRDFGEECAQLLRDRLRDERGLVARARLWLDLIRDCVIGVPRLHAAAQPMLPPVGDAPRPILGSMLWMEEDRRLRPISIAYASLLSLVAFGSVLLWMEQAVINAKGCWRRCSKCSGR